MLDSLLPLVQDWALVANLLTQHGSAPLFSHKMARLSNKALIPLAVQQQMQQVYYRTLSRSMVLQHAFILLTRNLQEAQIESVALKGIYLSNVLYGDIGLRQYSDLDILVRPEDGERTVQCLIDLGYRPHDPSVSPFIASQTEIVHYPPLVKEGVSVEVHIRLHRRNNNYELDTEVMLQRTVAFGITDITTHALCLHDLLIHLCIHLDKHFVGGHVQMKSFNDIVNLLRVHANTLDWERFKTDCRIYSCENTVFKYLLLTAEMYNIPVPEHVFLPYKDTVHTEDRIQFIRYLHCEYSNMYFTQTHWENIQHTKGMYNKVRYLAELVFPSRHFMIERYGLANADDKKQSTEDGIVNTRQPSTNYKLYFWWLWYPYRWWVGVKGLFNS
jgi:hypothetical protein